MRAEGLEGGEYRETHVLVRALLQSKVGGIVGRLESDVQLGEGNVDPELAESAHDLNVPVDILSSAPLGDQVSLETHAVDLDVGVAEHLDDALGTFDLGAGKLEVVVVVVELGTGVNLGGGLEGELDVLLAENLVEDGLAPSSVLVQGLVDDVPGVAAALPVPGHLGDVADDGLAEGLLGPGGGIDPGGELTVPDERVAPEMQAVLLRLGSDDLALGVVEEAWFGFDEEPLYFFIISSQI